MDRDERLQLAARLLDRIRERTEGLAVSPDEGEELRAFFKVMFEEGRIAGLVEATSVVLGDPS